MSNRLLLSLLLPLLLAAPLAFAAEEPETRADAIDLYLQQSAVFSAGAQPDFSLTDPTRFGRSGGPTFEWVNLSGGEGDIYLLHGEVTQSLGAKKQFGFLLDVPVGYADTNTVGNNFGFGDILLRFAWRPDSRGKGAFLGWALHFDVVFPTGNAGDALGGGDWIFAPAGIFKFKWAKAFVYLTARWLWADSVRPGGVRWFNVPGLDVVPNTIGTTRLSELNVEASFVWEFDRAKNPVHWFAITLDYGKNFADEKNDLLLGKVRLGRALADTVYVDLDMWFPIAGERTMDLTFRLALVWEF